MHGVCVCVSMLHTCVWNVCSVWCVGCVVYGGMVYVCAGCVLCAVCMCVVCDM